VPCHWRWPPLFYKGIDFPPHHLTLWSERSKGVLFRRSGFETYSQPREQFVANITSEVREHYAYKNASSWN
jgi:hypothetical protein